MSENEQAGASPGRGVVVGAWSAVQIKEFVLAILAEKDRALEMADREREKAAAALRNEQQRAMDQAERERVKAAEALRVELARAIAEGDDRLREHISTQIMQINAALTSAELLERQRIGGVSERQALLHEAIQVDLTSRVAACAASAEQHVAQLRRERELVTAAQTEAIQKAEDANEKRFEQANEWRGQSADRERTQQEQMQKFSATLMPREVADSRFGQNEKRLAELEKLGRFHEGRGVEKQETKVDQRAGVTMLISIATIVVVILIAIGTISFSRTSGGNSSPTVTVTTTVPTTGG